MGRKLDNDKYIVIIFSWDVKDSGIQGMHKCEKFSSIRIKGYWQGFIDVNNMTIVSIWDLNIPSALKMNVFKQGIYSLQVGNSIHECEYIEEIHESSHNSHVEDNIIYIGIGKDGVVANYMSDSEDCLLCESDTALKHEKFKRLYESAISIDEVVNVVEDANLIGKAVQIMLEYQQDSRDDSGELCLLNILRKALKSKTPMQIQSILLRDVLEDSYITYEELSDQGFSYEVI